MSGPETSGSIGSFGIRKNSSKWLIDFVSNRRGQFAGGRVAVDMGKFCHALPRLHFGQIDADDAHVAGPRLARLAQE